MDEASALLETLHTTAPDAPTACAGWTAHELVAHLAAGAAEMAGLVEDVLAGRPERPTRGFAEREAPFVALADDVLRDRLLSEALRLGLATERLGSAGDRATFTGRTMSAAEMSLHGRSEAALHRWDLVGSDSVSRDLLGQRCLTAHAVSVVSWMPATAHESLAYRAAAAGARPARLTFAAPGEADVVFVSHEGGARIELADPTASPTATADPRTRLLALWGRRTSPGSIVWRGDDADCGHLAALLWTD